MFLEIFAFGNEKHNITGIEKTPRCDGHTVRSSFRSSQLGGSADILVGPTVLWNVVRLPTRVFSCNNSRKSWLLFTISQNSNTLLQP